MVVISNSSPIIHLAKIGRLHLLEGLYSRILVPEKVYLECTDTVYYRNEVDLISTSSWIKRHSIEDDNYAGKQSIPATGLSPVRYAALWAANETHEKARKERFFGRQKTPAGQKASPCRHGLLK